MLNYDKKYIAKIIKNARLQKGLTQEEFAEKVGLSSKQISRIECGNFLPLLPSFFRIAQVLNLKLEDFGVNSVENKKQTLDKITQIISKMSESELECYYDILVVMVKNFKPVKKH